MSNKEPICINIQISSPYVTIKEYARVTGASKAKIQKMVNSGKLPIKPKETPKETVFINLIAIAKEAAMQQ